MTAVFAIVLIAHGLNHLLGFAKAAGFAGLRFDVNAARKLSLVRAGAPRLGR